MAKSSAEFRKEHEAFRARLRAIHDSAIGQAARVSMNDLRKAYRGAALEHWRELGPKASTGWGATPDSGTRNVEQCADTISSVLAQYFSNDPDDPPGSMKAEVQIDG